MERANRQEILAVFLFVQNGKIREILILVLGINKHYGKIKTFGFSHNADYCGILLTLHLFIKRVLTMTSKAHILYLSNKYTHYRQYA